VGADPAGSRTPVATHRGPVDDGENAAGASTAFKTRAWTGAYAAASRVIVADAGAVGAGKLDERPESDVEDIGSSFCPITAALNTVVRAASGVMLAAAAPAALSGDVCCASLTGRRFHQRHASQAPPPTRPRTIRSRESI
jgi:hypothetical protein